MTAMPAPEADGQLDELLAWDFSDRLRKIRRRVVDTGQREFAAQLGVSWQAYAAWEAGRNLPQNIVALARRIEATTGVPAAWVLGVDSPGSAAAANIQLPGGSVQNYVRNTCSGRNFGHSSPSVGRSGPRRWARRLAAAPDLTPVTYLFSRSVISPPLDVSLVG